MGRGFLFIAFASFAPALLGACPATVSLGFDDAGGLDDAGAPDAAPAFCVPNPRFTGIGTTDDGGLRRGRGISTPLNSWVLCDVGIDPNPSSACMLAPPTGSTNYLGFDVFVDPQGDSVTAVSAQLIPAVPPGSYPFTIELGQMVTYCRRGSGTGSAPVSVPVELRIYGSMTACGRTEELEMLPIVNTDGWMKYVGTLTAHQAFSYIVLVPTLTNAAGGPLPTYTYVVVGDFLSQTCPTQ